MGRGRRRELNRRRRAVADVEAGMRWQVFTVIAGLRESAFRNFRQSLANLPIFFGIVSAYFLATGEADSGNVVPLAICVVGGVLGVGTYVFGRRRRAADRLLAVALVTGGVGIAGLVSMV